MTQGELVRLLDVTIAVSAGGAAVIVAIGRGVEAGAGPLVNLLLRPPVLPERLQPARWLNELATQGGHRRDDLAGRLSAVLDVAVPALVAQVVQRLDTADLVHRYVDLDRIIYEVDLPEIIRESTGAMASDSLRGLRMHSISGDDAIGRAVARLRARRTNGSAP